MVKWSKQLELWYLSYGWSGPSEDLVSMRQQGIVIGTPSAGLGFLVHWPSGEILEQSEEDLEVISESR